MKRYIFILAAALSSCSFAYGDEQPDSAKQTAPQYHRISFGPDIFCSPNETTQYLRDFDIHTSVNTTFAGLKVEYDYLKPRAFYFGMDGLAAIGKTSVTTRATYYEHLSFLSIQEVPPKRKKTTPLFANLEQRYGYTFQSAFAEKSKLIPFGGIGCYYFREQFNKGSSFDSWFYVAAGLRLSQQFSENFDIGFNLKAMFNLFETTEYPKFHYIGRKNIWGYEIAIPCTWRVGASKKWDLQFQPYLLKLDINSSNQIFGLRLLTGYSF